MESFVKIAEEHEYNVRRDKRYKKKNDSQVRKDDLQLDAVTCLDLGNMSATKNDKDILVENSKSI